MFCHWQKLAGGVLTLWQKLRNTLLKKNGFCILMLWQCLLDRCCAACLMCLSLCSSHQGATNQVCCVFDVFIRPQSSSDHGATSQALCCVFDVFMFFRLGGCQPGVVLCVLCVHVLLTRGLPARCCVFYVFMFFRPGGYQPGVVLCI